MLAHADICPRTRLSPLFCAGVTAYRAITNLGLAQGSKVGVFGLGGVGSFAVRFAVAMGYEVLGFDVSQHARETALRYGAVRVADSGINKAVSTAVSSLTDGVGLDGSIVCAGVGDAYRQAIEFTGPGGYVSYHNITTLTIPKTNHK